MFDPCSTGSSSTSHGFCLLQAFAATASSLAAAVIRKKAAAVASPTAVAGAGVGAFPAEGCGEAGELDPESDAAKNARLLASSSNKK